MRRRGFRRTPFRARRAMLTARGRGTHRLRARATCDEGTTRYFSPFAVLAVASGQGTQAPARQTCPVGHTLPHRPQCRASSCSCTQTPPPSQVGDGGGASHTDQPGAHPTMHRPPKQVAAAQQGRPQEVHAFASGPTSTQRPSHRRCPEGQLESVGSASVADASGGADTSAASTMSKRSTSNGNGGFSEIITTSGRSTGVGGTSATSIA